MEYRGDLSLTDSRHHYPKMSDLALQKIPSFEGQMFRPGYAIEYDFFPPTQLKLTLETQLIDGLYRLVRSMARPAKNMSRTYGRN